MTVRSKNYYYLFIYYDNIFRNYYSYDNTCLIFDMLLKSSLENLVFNQIICWSVKPT